MQTCTARQNHEWLTTEYLNHLAAQNPTEVLDIGCGSGMLLKACRERGIHATGVEAPGPSLDELKQAGFEVTEGSAYDLPFEDQSIDWLSLRHVPHHLEHPARAFAELLRVAKRGVTLAEPHFDCSESSQAGAAALDVWEKRQHRRLGRTHDEVYNLGALLGLLPADYADAFTVEAHRTLRLRGRDVAQFAIEAKDLVAGLDAKDPECHSLESLIRDLEQSSLSWNGSLLLVLTRT